MFVVVAFVVFLVRVSFKLPNPGFEFRFWIWVLGRIPDYSGWSEIGSRIRVPDLSRATFWMYFGWPKNRVPDPGLRSGLISGGPKFGFRFGMGFRFGIYIGW